MRQELRNCPKSEHLSHSDIRLFKKSMYEARRKIFPKIPKSLFEAKTMIFQNKNYFVSNNEPFYFMNSKVVYLFLQMLLTCHIYTCLLDNANRL
jgi:hypothetical protein